MFEVSFIIRDIRIIRSCYHKGSANCANYTNIRGGSYAYTQEVTRIDVKGGTYRCKCCKD